MSRLSTCWLRLGVGLCLALLSPVAQAQISVNVSPGSTQGAGFGQMAPSHNATIAIHSTNGPFYGMISGSPNTMWTYAPAMGTTSDVTISGVIREDEMGALQVSGMWMNNMMLPPFNVHVANVTFPCKTPTCDPMNPMSCMGGGGSMCDPVIEGELSVAPGHTVGTSIRVCCGLPGTLTVTPASSEIELLDANGAPLAPLSLGAGEQSVSIQIRALTTFTGGDQLTARFVHGSGGSSAADVLNVVEGTPPPTVEIAQIIDIDSDPEGMEADDTPPLQKYVGNGLTLQAIPDPAGGTFSPAVVWTLTAKPMDSMLDDTMPLGTGDTVAFTPDIEGTYTITATSGSSSMSIDLEANPVGILKIVDTDSDPEGDQPDDTSPLRKQITLPTQLQIFPDPATVLFPPMQPTWTITRVDPSLGNTIIATGVGAIVDFTPQDEGDYSVEARSGNDIKTIQIAAVDDWEAAVDTAPTIKLRPGNLAKVKKGQTIDLVIEVEDFDLIKKISGREELRIPGIRRTQQPPTFVRQGNTMNATLTGRKVSFLNKMGAEVNEITVTLDFDGSRMKWMGFAKVKVADNWEGTTPKLSVVVVDEQDPPPGFRVARGSLRDPTNAPPFEVNWQEATRFPTSMTGIRQSHTPWPAGGARVPSPPHTRQTTNDMQIIYQFGPAGFDYSGVTVNETFDPWTCRGIAYVTDFQQIYIDDATRVLGRAPTSPNEVFQSMFGINFSLVIGTFTIEANATLVPGQTIYICADQYIFAGYAEALLSTLRINFPAQKVTVTTTQHYFCPYDQEINSNTLTGTAILDVNPVQPGNQTEPTQKVAP